MHLNFLLFLILVVLTPFNSIKAQYGYFYDGKDYGSESTIHPLKILLNGGFDIKGLDQTNNDIRKVNYRNGSRVTFYSLTHPKKTIEQRIGFRDFIFSEVIPSGFSSSNSQWIPNYTLHLLGGGVEYSYLTDYFTFHKIKSPKIFAAITTISYHYLNEVVEHGDNTWLHYDAVADFYFFNFTGILLFNLERVQYFFSHEMIIRNWSDQVSFSIFNGAIQNVGQNFSMKWKPFFKDQPISLFTHFGLGVLGGLGYDKKDLTYSFGVGYRTRSVEIINERNKQVNVLFMPSYGLFVDKKNSLLMSIIYTNDNETKEHLKLDIFPGVIKMKKLKIGLWGTLSKSQSSSFGLVLSWLPGLSF